MNKLQKSLKCMIWDIDNTLWNGTLVEGDDVVLKEGVVDTLKTLDERGILHSIASKNDFDATWERIEAFGIGGYFLYPQINWGSKSASIQRIAEEINIGIDALGFIDDQIYEREEVRYSHPKVSCYDASEYRLVCDYPEFIPRFITADSACRRSMYRAEQARKTARESSGDPDRQFLASLNMKFTIAPAQEEGLRRAEELTLRTNQLNTTGVVYSYDELLGLSKSDRHVLLVASLEDRFGSYGKIGLVLIEKGAEVWTIQLFLMSCRVISRGIGGILLNHVVNLANDAGVELDALFMQNDRNRLMHVTYCFAGFCERIPGTPAVLRYEGVKNPPMPEDVEICIDQFNPEKT
ncbi:MAG: HAD-IIIC family phosphatase [Proteobacteria bacterium]|nr:HAD-IIIC family phosphatase [Pseudomonadota bacterium]